MGWLVVQYPFLHLTLLRYMYIRANYKEEAYKQNKTK